jgi:hypothetical protein
LVTALETGSPGAHSAAANEILQAVICFVAFVFVFYWPVPFGYTLSQTAALYDMFPPSTAAVKPAGKWNSSRLVFAGKHGEHWLNGVKVLSYELGSAEVKAALAASETGHFVMSTLHTTDATETITRVIDFFPPHEQKQVRLALAGALRGIICQRLVPRADGQGRCVAMEICVATGRIADAIVDPDKTGTIAELIKEGAYYGMQTFDQHLVALIRDGVITLEAAMAASTSPHDLTVELRRLGLVA